ncbi:MAG: SET domain-containing protein [Chitinophagaceae bacterium]|nr:SET domain-containing protein [Chitinophagaceae bacterium]
MNLQTIAAKEEDYLYVSTSQLPNSGMGLFTAIKIFKDEIIAIYKGEILFGKEATRRAQKGEDHYFMTLSDKKTIDAMHTDGFAKFANDAEGKLPSSYKNNSKITKDEKGNVVLVALKNIAQEEEIFCSYGKAYWQKHG